MMKGLHLKSILKKRICKNDIIPCTADEAITECIREHFDQLKFSKKEKEHIIEILRKKNSY